MTVEELGFAVKQLTNAVVSRDYLAVLNLTGVGYQAVTEFLAGFQNVPRGSAGSLAVVDLGLLEPEIVGLDCACKLEEADPTPRGAMPAAGFNPMWIPVIIEGVRALLKLLKDIKDNRTDPVTP